MVHILVGIGTVAIAAILFAIVYFLLTVWWRMRK